MFAITAAQWQADLQSLVAFLESTHPNLFFHVRAQDFNGAVNDLNQSIPQLSDDQITVRMMQLVAMVGDAHMVVYSPLFAFLPIRWFSDGLLVNAATPEHRQALGVRVIQIGNLPVDQAYDAVSTVIPHENDYWVREMTETYLGTPDLLAGLGITSGWAPSRISSRICPAPNSESRFRLPPRTSSGRRTRPTASCRSGGGTMTLTTGFKTSHHPDDLPGLQPL